MCPDSKQDRRRRLAAAGLAVFGCLALCGCRAAPARPATPVVYVDLRRLASLHPALTTRAAIPTPRALMAPLGPAYPIEPPAAPELPGPAWLPPRPALPLAPDRERMRAELREELELQRAARPDRAQEAYLDDVDRLRAEYQDPPPPPGPTDPGPALRESAAFEARRSGINAMLRALRERPDDPVRYTSAELERRADLRRRAAAELERLAGPVVAVFDDTPAARRRRELERSLRELEPSVESEAKLRPAERERRQREYDLKVEELTELLESSGENLLYAARQVPVDRLRQQLSRPGEQYREVPPARVRALAQRRDAAQLAAREALAAAGRARQARAERLTLPGPPTIAPEVDGAEEAADAARRHISGRVGPPAGRKSHPPGGRSPEAAAAAERERSVARSAALRQDVLLAVQAAARRRGVDVRFEPGAGPDWTETLRPDVRALLRPGG